ncbi:MAG: plasmid mobilization relaxosome protein MobC [Lachnospiraceae bacterium]|nr:plasmid mobilization relaxosome protein MobC [Lachnospiraceae bacterium]
MKKYNRRRNRAITIRMNEHEYNDITNKIHESGLTQQAYMINAALDTVIATSDTVAELKCLNKTFSDFERQLRGLATNVNQIAHVANGLGAIPTLNELETISDQIATYRKESESQWQSIRSLIKQQKATGQ